jgi:hypothetical protein
MIHAADVDDPPEIVNRILLSHRLIHLRHFPR